MARTHKDKRHTRPAKEAYWARCDELPVGAWIGQFEHWRDQPYAFGGKLRGGNMVMGHRASGEWDDCRASDSTGRKVQRRVHKRRERQRWQREVREDS